MTREEARTALRALAAGLAPDVEGVRRLLERISVHTDAEALRDFLTEEGAARLLEDEEETRWT